MGWSSEPACPRLHQEEMEEKAPAGQIEGAARGIHQQPDCQVTGGPASPSHPSTAKMRPETPRGLAVSPGTIDDFFLLIALFRHVSRGLSQQTVPWDHHRLHSRMRPETVQNRRIAPWDHRQLRPGGPDSSSSGSLSFVCVHWPSATDRVLGPSTSLISVVIGFIGHMG